MQTFSSKRMQNTLFLATWCNKTYQRASLTGQKNTSWKTAVGIEIPTARHMTNANTSFHAHRRLVGTKIPTGQNSEQ